MGRIAAGTPVVAADSGVRRVAAGAQARRQPPGAPEQGDPAGAGCFLAAVRCISMQPACLLNARGHGVHRKLKPPYCRYPDGMRHQRLESLAVEGFTSIVSAALTLRDVNVLVGANGAGKSNFIRALGMLGRIVDGRYVRGPGQRRKKRPASRRSGRCPG